MTCRRDALEFCTEYKWTVQGLSDAAWSTSSVTGATGFVSYSEVARYQELYFYQQLLKTTMDRYLDSRLETSFMESMNGGGKPSTAELEGTKHALASQLIANRVLREVGNQLNVVYTRFMLEGK